MPHHRDFGPPSTRVGGSPWRSGTRSLMLLLLAGLIGLVVAGPAAGGSVGAAQTSATGESRAEPVPLGQEAVAGPLRITINEVVSGPAAVDRVLAASPRNTPPADGQTFVLADVTVHNEGDAPIFVSNDDFGLTGASGVIYRFLIAQPPEPALAATLEPGATVEGWLVFAAPVTETELLLVFDSLSMPGTWARRTLALGAGSTIPDAARPSAIQNDVGRSPESPAGLNTPIVSGTWQVELVDVAFGAEVFELVDFRTGALGVDDSDNETPWLALRIRVTNVGTGGEPSYFPPNAFALADTTGARLLDVVTLTPPVPDASGDYYPGATREGWVAFELPSYDPYLILFDPYDATTESSDPRYLTYQ